MKEKALFSRIDRRRFLAHVGMGLAAGIGAGLDSMSSAQAVEPIHRPGKPRLRLSMAAYSFRDYFKPNAKPKMDLHRFIDYCADHSCDGTELTSYYFPKNLTRDYLIEIKRHAFLRGLDISGTAVGNNFALPDGPDYRSQIALVKQWIDYAAVFGAPHIRVFAGRAKGIDKKEAKKQCIRALEECGDYAAKYGIWLGLENHGGIVADVNDLLDIIRSVQSRWVGVNLDTGNFWATDNPYHDMERLAPYAVNVQYKVKIRWPGRGKVPSDPKRIKAILENAGYQGYVALEYEENDPWGEIPQWLARLREVFEGG